MIKFVSTLLLLLICNNTFSQKLLASWSQQNIENYTLEMYNEAQKLSSAELLEKNLNDEYWSEVFLTINASVNNYSKDIEYQRGLANQITNTKETKLKGTSRLIIWERIISGDITFEGKGLIIDNDMYTVASRANQILQNLTNKNFGFVGTMSNDEELLQLKNKWLDYFSGKSVEEFEVVVLENAKLPEISNELAINALVVSLQENPIKDQITKKCLKNVYGLDEMPKEIDAQARLCNPDRNTFAYLGILFGDEKVDESKDANWWLNFWSENNAKIDWDSSKRIFEIKQ